MRKMILMLALAGVAMPVAAQRDEDWSERRAARAEQRQQAEERQQAERQQAERPQVERQQAEQRQQAERQQERSEQRQQERASETPRAEPSRETRGEARGNWQRPDTAQAPDASQVARWRERREENRARQASDGTVPATRWSDRVRQPSSGGDNQPTPQGQAAPVIHHGTQGDYQRQSDGSRDGRRWDGQRRLDGQRWDGQRTGTQWQGTQQQTRHWNGHRDGRRWSNNWRRDTRYDWQRYRSHNRSIFRVGRYYDPFGWGYRRLSVGFTLYSGYYRPNYWLDDPWQYRLPPVYGPYRWVRYYDDAVLVDVYSGEVVDVIRGFFW